MSPFLRRRSGLGDVFTMQRLLALPGGQDLLREIRSRADDPDEARAVNRYAAAISMPKDMLCEEALKINRTNWSHLYDLAKKFEVTITALTVRLSQFNLLYIKRDGKQIMLYESAEDAMGQMTLGL
jgi:Zn-dependent peptidase ImmA (M78 family)